jgi:hypothetical protein
MITTIKTDQINQAIHLQLRPVILPKADTKPQLAKNVPESRCCPQMKTRPDPALTPES